MKKTNIMIVAMLLVVVSAFSQDKLTIEESIMGAYGEFRPESVSNLHWVPGEDAYYYTEGDAEVEKIVKVAVGSKDMSTIMSTKEMSNLLKSVGSNEIESFRALSWTDDNKIVFSNGAAFWKYNLEDGTIAKLAEIRRGEKVANHDPDSNFEKIAFTMKNNLFYNDGDGVSMAITTETNPDIVSGQAIHRYEFGIAKGTFWSPESNYLAYYQKDESMVSDYPLVDYSTSPASNAAVKYPMAGQASHVARVGVYSLSSSKSVYLKTGTLDDHYLTNLTWSPDENFIYLAEINRDQNHMRLNKYDAGTGKLIKTLFEETNDKYVEPEHGPYFLKDTKGEFLWYSEKDGHNHLYRYNADGKLLNQVTSGDIEVHDILDYNSKTKKLIFTATHKPTEVFAYSVDLQGKKQSILTEEPGTHNVEVSSDSKYLIDSYSSLEVPRKTVVMDMNSKVQKVILESENPLKDKKVGSTDLFTIPAKDGTDLWCRMIKPSDFDAKKKYPVLVYVYGGPHAQMVVDTWGGGASLWMNYMTERGYIIFTLDNRGSSNRGIEFEQKVFRNIGDQELKDQLLGVEYLKSLPYVDADRMAIHGWSFGGFMTTSMMTRYPDVFKVGVAGGPVIDWSLYEVMYTERYMDTPQANPDGFEKAKVTNYAKDLKGDLLLIHGTSDDVVVMQNSISFLKQCVDDGVQVDFFVYPGHKHNVRGGDRVHLMTKVLDYIEDKLGTD